MFLRSLFDRKMLMELGDVEENIGNVFIYQLVISETSQRKGWLRGDDMMKDDFIGVTTRQLTPCTPRAAEQA